MGTIRARLSRVIILCVASCLGATVVLGVVRALEDPLDNQEVQRLHDEDQADRTPPEGSPIDWAVVLPRDHARLSRVKELFAAGALTTANDYYRAAMVLQHGNEPEDFLLAHEFCVVAIVLGKNDKEAKWLAASAEDRFLMNLGRSQRFGTQFNSADGGPWQLYQVDPTLTDAFRELMGTHTLAEAKAREVELNRK